MAPQETVVQRETVNVPVTSHQPTVPMKPVPLLPFWGEPAALLLVLGLLTWMLARLLRRRPTAWPVPSLLGLEAGRPGRPEAEPAPEPASLPEPVSMPSQDEPAPVAADAAADHEAREEELELVT